MDKKIKICFVQAYAYAVFNPESRAKIGGAEVDLFNIATELAKDDRFDIYFLVADFGQKDLEIYNNIKVVKGHSQEKSLLNYLLAFIKFYRKLIEINADIYFTANLSKYVGFTNLYSKLTGRIHIHRTEHQHQVNKKIILKHILRGELRYLLFLLGFMNVDHIVVQNEEDHNLLKKSFNYPSNVIRNSYPIQKIVNKERKFILWVARSEKWKQPHLFIHLAKVFPNEQFIMIMPLADDIRFFRKIEQEAMKVHNLEFIPGVPFSEVEKFYQNAKVFVNTSSAEGFPNSFNQAMNSSTPLLSFSINPDNFIGKHKVGLYCNNNFEELKRNLKELLNNRKLWKELSENAFNYVFNEMNIEKSIKKWKKIFFYLFSKRYRKKSNLSNR
jgi:glycosyltransferase involved in cell wall biosynthesis